MSEESPPPQRRRLRKVTEDDEEDEEDEQEDEEEEVPEVVQRRAIRRSDFVADDVSISGDDVDEEESELNALEAAELEESADFIAREREDRSGREQRAYNDSVRDREIEHELAENKRYLAELKERSAAPVRQFDEEPSFNALFAPPRPEAVDESAPMEVDEEEKKDEPMVVQDFAIVKTFVAELTKFSNALFEQLPEDLPLVADLRCYKRDVVPLGAFVHSTGECVRVPSCNFAISTVIGGRWASDAKGLLFQGVFSEPGVQPMSAALFLGQPDKLPETPAGINQEVLRELRSCPLIVLNPPVIRGEEHIDLMELLDKAGFEGSVALMYNAELGGVDRVSQPLPQRHPEANARTIEFIDALLPVLGNPRSDLFARSRLEFHGLSARSLSPFMSKVGLESLRNSAAKAELLLYRATQQGVLAAPLPIITATASEAHAWNALFAAKFTGEAKAFPCTPMANQRAVPYELQHLSVALFRRHRVMLMCDVENQPTGALGTVVDLFDDSVEVFFDQAQSKTKVPFVVATSQLSGGEATYMYLPLTPAFALTATTACAFANVDDCIFSGRNFEFSKDLFSASRTVAGRRWFTEELGF